MNKLVIMSSSGTGKAKGSNSKGTTKKNNFDPLGDIKSIIMEYYSSGKLPIIALGLTLIYNLIFFSYPTGYQIYIIVPALSTFILFGFQYWNRKDSRRSMITSVILLAFSAAFDLFVSISFELSPGDYNYRSIPSIILDTIAILAFFGWYYDFRVEDPDKEESHKTEEVYKEDWDEDKSQDMMEKMIKRSEEIEEEVKKMDN